MGTKWRYLRPWFSRRVRQVAGTGPGVALSDLGDRAVWGSLASETVPPVAPRAFSATVCVAELSTVIVRSPWGGTGILGGTGFMVAGMSYVGGPDFLGFADCDPVGGLVT